MTTDSLLDEAADLPLVRGHFDAQFGAVAREFDRNLRERGETGAAVCVYHRGRPVVDIAGGDYELDTIQVMRSTTKGLLGILAHLLRQRGQLDLDAPVSALWPDFGQAGKADITVRSVLSHQAGLPYLEEPISVADALAWQPAITALERQRPLWPSGTDHGYHDMTYGWLVGEILRRASGVRVGELVRRELAEPLGIDLWIGMPLRRMRGLRPVRAAEGGRRLNLMPESASAADEARLAQTAANPDIRSWEHRPEYLAAEMPGSNGVGQARGLAKLYAALIGEVDGVRLFDEQSLAEACAVRAAGPDRVVGWERRYATGFMLTDPTRPMAGEHTRSFGYYGQGGLLTFADPDSGLAFAYFTIQEQLHLGADPRANEVARAAYDCAVA
ncbi:serine hydrolase domain-containing protein [Gandjariella thermophila]|uniref:Esterase n=1 Tax=Gandjariella thermophila TaxID=1931992 RepID=A0A4D4JIU9_9PSEU|nr:serine hydrolase domain-containing protein [Gandjariella thermophila]GDY33813.1 esterase [Gandjariella thermophila]